MIGACLIERLNHLLSEAVVKLNFNPHKIALLGAAADERLQKSLVPFMYLRLSLLVQEVLWYRKLLVLGSLA
jgi:hypothetical protein